MKKGKMIGYFIADQQSDFYQSTQFTTVLRFIQGNPNLGKLKEKETRNGLRLLLVFDHIKTLDRAYKAIQPLSPQLLDAEIKST
jgi:transcription-repair coupling factor (superfamily II helicase)